MYKIKNLVVILLLLTMCSCAAVTKTVKKTVKKKLNTKSVAKYTQLVVRKFKLPEIMKECRDTDLCFFILKSLHVAEKTLKENKNITNTDVKNALYEFGLELKNRSTVMFKVYITVLSCFPIMDSDNEIISLKYRDYLYTIISTINSELKNSTKNLAI